MHPPRNDRLTGAGPALLGLVLGTLAVAVAQGQQPPTGAAGATLPTTAPATAPAPQIPRPDELEPGVNTSTAAAPAPSERPAASAAAPRGGSPGAKTAPSAPASSQAPAAAADPKAAKAASPKGADRLQLDATEITGNRELPKVLYIVPWKRSDLGDVVGKPMNSLVDEVLQPIDRDVFQRENRYYDSLSPAANAPKPGAVPGSGN